MDLNTVNDINDSPYKVYFAITGGGQSFLGSFMRISGASKTVVGAIIPYSPAVFDKFIGNKKVSSYASNEAARKLALASYAECSAAGVESQYAIGIGASSSLGKDNERVGREHTIHIVAHTWNSTHTWDITLKQGRLRPVEDKLASDAIFDMLAHVTIGTSLPDLILHTDELSTIDHEQNTDVGLMLLSRPDHSYLLQGDKKPFGKELAIYSGSWNPFHDGHLGIYQTAAEILGCKPYLELSLRNADKGTIDFVDLYRRMDSIVPQKPLILTQAPTYYDKVKLLRNVYHETNPITFIVGADTWVRIWDEKYVPMSLSDLEKFFFANGVKFLVFGRDGNPIVHPMGFGEDLRIKHSRAEQYSSPVSSTSLRQQS